MKRDIGSISLLWVAGVSLLLAACASMGRPEGGPRDTVPPRYVSSKPEPGVINYTNPKIEITFDENVKIEDATNRVVVSPAQRTPATVTALGRKVIVELRDTLLANTTYTIDFSDAVRDLNEGNILDGFATDFSTGPERDSLQISGMVFEARNLEPAQAMLVGAYRIDNLPDTVVADSLIVKRAFDRIAKTNQLGQFTLRNLKEGKYRVYAVKDNNRDYYWDRSEDVAFYDVDVVPGHQPGVAVDTLTAIDGTDSIVSRAVTVFTPNDVLMTWFNEDYRSQYLRDYKRVDRRRLTIDFGAKSDTLPDMTIVNGPNAGRKVSDWALVQANATLDTLVYWIKDSDVLAQDSLLVATRYLRTDSLNKLSFTTDTLKLFYREPKKKDKKKAEEDSVAKINYLVVNKEGRAQQDLHRPVVISWSDPLDTLYRDGLHLWVKNDTVWNPIALPERSQGLRRTVRGMPAAVFTDTISYNWEPGGEYRLEVDSAAVWSVYGEHNRPTRIDFTVKREEDYATLIFKVDTYGEPMVVELLSGADKPEAQMPVVDGVATFSFLNPGTYFARAYVDANGNGAWDAGNVMAHRQAEDVYYYPKKLNIRPNWDVEQTWDINALPLDEQKPNEIKKNKPVTKEKSVQYDDEEDEFDDEFNSNFYEGPGSQYDNNHRGFGGNRGGMKSNRGNNQLAR